MLSEIDYDRDLIIEYFIYFYDLIFRIIYDYVGADRDLYPSRWVMIGDQS